MKTVHINIYLSHILFTSADTICPVQFYERILFYFILYMSWDNKVGIMTRLWAGQQSYCGSIPSKV